MSRMFELLRLVDTCREIQGRKKLQKMVHLLREAGHPFGYRFEFHFHGPFSAELKGAIDSFVAQKLIAERVAEPPGEYRQYSYASTPELKRLLEDFGGTGDPEWAELAKRLNGKPAQDLEAISTVAFLMRCGHGGDELKERFMALKPQLANLFDSAQTEAGRIVARPA